MIPLEKLGRPERSYMGTERDSKDTLIRYGEKKRKVNWKAAESLSNLRATAG